MNLFIYERSYLLTAVLVLALLLSSPVMAQERTASTEIVDNEISGVASITETEEALLDPNLYMGLQEAYQRTLRLRTPEVQPRELKTLFFTLWQHRLLQEAKRSNWMNRDPHARELEKDPSPAQRPRGIRELSLGGILYTTPDNWIVWLNSQRVTPTAIPKQVMDIQVREDYIELKWYDTYTNLIFPIRLRAHQRFNLDNRIFLPGTSTL